MDERAELAWRGADHSPDNIYIHFSDHDALMLVDVVNSGWVPIYNLNLSEDVPGYIQSPATALPYPSKHFIGGHLCRLGTRDDIVLHQQYIADIEASAREALASVDPTGYFMQYGENVWAAVKGYLDELTDRAAAPVIAKYTGVLAAADVEAFTRTTTFTILQSMRLDLGPGSPLPPLTRTHRASEHRPRCARTVSGVRSIPRCPRLAPAVRPGVRVALASASCPRRALLLAGTGPDWLRPRCARRSRRSGA